MEDYRKIAIELGQTLINKAPETREDVERMLPELKESEDEKMSRELIAHFKNNSVYVKWSGLDVKKVIQWLEKQGEKESADKVEPKFKVGDEIKTKNEESFTITRIDRWGYWSEDLFICNFDDANKWELVEQKPAWSEEDEYYYGIIQYILNNECVGKTDKEEAINWLKSIKDRVQPQPKQEWSEEDERNLNDAILFIETGTYSLDKDNLINWLKSLRPQSQWKPSDEQIKALWEVYKGGEEQAALASLWNDLKKLRKE